MRFTRGVSETGSHTGSSRRTRVFQTHRATRWMSAALRSAVIVSIVALFACEGPSRREVSTGVPAGMSSEEWGEQLFSAHGCPACHSINAVASVGPPLGIPKDEPTDLAKFRRDILEPSVELSEGYENVMPSYASILGDDAVDALASYLLQLEQGG